MYRRWKPYIKIVKQILAAVKRARISLYAAQAAFFVIFSAIPLCLLLFSATRILMPSWNESLGDAIVKYYNASGLQTNAAAVQRYLATSSAAASASLFAVLWSSTRGVRAVAEGISDIYGSRFGKRNLFFRYTYSLLYTVILIGAVLSALSVLAFGGQLLGFLARVFPTLDWVWQMLYGWRYCIAALLFVFLFALLYRMLGQKGMAYRRHLPGAVFSAGGWIVYSLLFSLYLKHFSIRRNLYGGFSVLLSLMFWTYSCMYMIMLGALINVYFMRRARLIK